MTYNGADVYAVGVQRYAPSTHTPSTSLIPGSLLCCRILPPHAGLLSNCSSAVGYWGFASLDIACSFALFLYMPCMSKSI